MKTRIVEINTGHQTRFICQYKRFLFWRPCNTALTNLPGPSYRHGYPTRKAAEARIAQFLRNKGYQLGY